MAGRSHFSAALAVAMLVAGCSTTTPDGEHKRLLPFPWLHKILPKHVAAPSLPQAEAKRGGFHKEGGADPASGEEVTDAVVRYEPYVKWANRPYSMFGQTYVPILHEEPFVQRGIASYYGNRFHGQKTSSGELYDMNKMTAAHPTLPIPSYARVTSVENGRSVIVRINDRGPFHANRIIDVSYAAALKLGLMGKGSHLVEIERLFPDDPARVATLRRAAASQAQSAAPEVALRLAQDRVRGDSAAVAELAQQAPQGYYVHLGSYSRAGTAESVSEKLSQAGVALGTLEVVKAGAVNRLFGGPFATRAEALEAARAIPSSFKLRPIVVRR